MHRGRILAGALAAGSAVSSPAPAGELVMGFGADGLRGESTAPALVIEGRATPFWTGTFIRPGAAVGLGAAAQADTDDDFWGGAGVVLTLPVDPIWRVEASLMLGAYSRGSGEDLGARAPIFRTQVGASRALATGWRAGVALDHKSNAGTASPNPGVETLLVTLTRSF